MGYTTDFHGRFTLDKPLTLEQAKYLYTFACTRRVKRNANLTLQRDDPIRKAVGLPVGEEGEFFVGESGFYGQDDGSDVLDGNGPPTTQPGLWCQWVPSEDGLGIEWDGGEKFYRYVEWLRYIIKNFLKPWGLTLNGEVHYQGESKADRGTIYCVGNVVTKDPSPLQQLAIASKTGWEHYDSSVLEEPEEEYY